MLGTPLFAHSFAHFGFSLSAATLTLELPLPSHCMSQLDLFTLLAGASRLGLAPSSGAINLDFSLPLRSPHCLDFLTSALDIVRVGPLLPLRVLSYLDLSLSASRKTAQSLPMLDFAFLDSLVLLRHSASCKLLSVSEFSKAEPSTSTRSFFKTGPVLFVGMLRVGMPLLICSAVGMAASLPSQSNLKIEALMTVFSAGQLGPFPSLHCLNWLGSILPVAKGVHLDFALLVLDLSLSGVSILAQNFMKLDSAVLVCGSSGTDSFPTVRRSLGTGSCFSAQNCCSLDFAPFVPSAAHLDSLLSVHALCRASSPPATDFANSDAVLLLHGLNQLGPSFFPLGICCLELSLVVLDNSFVSALPLKSPTRLETLLPPVGLSRVGFVFVLSVYDFAALGSLLPLQSSSWPGFLLSIAFPCLEPSLLLRRFSCSGFPIPTCRTTSAGYSLPALDFSLESFLPLQAASQLDLAAAVHTSTSLDLSIPLKICSCLGASIFVLGAKSLSFVPVPSFTVFDSFSSLQGCAKVEPATFTLDFAHVNFLLLLQSTGVGNALTIHGSKRSDLPPPILAVGNLELLLPVHGLSVSGSRPLVAETIFLDFSFLVRSSCRIGASTLLLGSTSLGFCLMACSAVTLGLSPVMRSFVRLTFLPPFDSTKMEPILLLRHFLRMGSSASIEGKRQETMQATGVENAAFLGAPLSSHSLAYLDLPVFPFLLGHLGIMPLIQSIACLDASSFLFGAAFGSSTLAFDFGTVGFLPSLQQVACFGSFVSASSPSNLEASPSLQSCRLGMVMLALNVVFPGFSLSAIGICSFGLPFSVKSFAQTGFRVLVLDTAHLESFTLMRCAACLGTPMLAFGMAGLGNLQSLLVIDDAQTDLSPLVRSFTQFGSPLSAPDLAQTGLSLSMRSFCRLGLPLPSFSAGIGLLLLCLEFGQTDSTVLLQGVGHFDFLPSVSAFAHPGLPVAVRSLKNLGPVLFVTRLSGKALSIFDVSALEASLFLKNLARSSSFLLAFDYSRPGIPILLQQFSYTDTFVLSLGSLHLGYDVSLVDVARSDILISLRRVSYLDSFLLLCDANRLDFLLLLRSFQRLDLSLLIVETLHVDFLLLLRSLKGAESPLLLLGLSRPGLCSSLLVADSSLVELSMSSQQISWLDLASPTLALHVGSSIFLHGLARADILILSLACSRLGIPLPVSSAVDAPLLIQSLSQLGSVLLLGSVGQLGSCLPIFGLEQLSLPLPLRSLACLDLFLSVFCLSSGTAHSLSAIGSQHFEPSVLVQGLARSGAALSFIMSTSSGPLIPPHSLACVELLILTLGASNSGRCDVLSLSVLDCAHTDLSLSARSSG